MVEKVTRNITFQLWKLKDYSVMIDERTFFDQTIKNDLRIYDKFKKLKQVKVMITQLDIY